MFQCILLNLLTFTFLNEHEYGSKELSIHLILENSRWYQSNEKKNRQKIPMAGWLSLLENRVIAGQGISLIPQWPIHQEQFHGLKLPAQASHKQTLNNSILFLIGIKWQSVDNSVTFKPTVKGGVPHTLGMGMSYCFTHEEKPCLPIPQFVFEIFLNSLSLIILPTLEKSLTNFIFTECISQVGGFPGSCCSFHPQTQSELDIRKFCFGCS